MTSLCDQSKTCFVFPDGEGGWVVKMTQPNGKPLEFTLDLHKAVNLNKQLTDAVAAMVRPPEPGQPLQYFQK